MTPRVAIRGISAVRDGVHRDRPRSKTAVHPCYVLASSQPRPSLVPAEKSVFPQVEGFRPSRSQLSLYFSLEEEKVGEGRGRGRGGRGNFFYKG